MNSRIQLKRIVKKYEIKSKTIKKQWLCIINNKEISVIKFSKDWYNGSYEIYSYEIMFNDVERFSNKLDMVKRLKQLKELENKKCIVSN